MPPILVSFFRSCQLFAKVTAWELGEFRVGTRGEVFVSLLLGFFITNSVARWTSCVESFLGLFEDRSFAETFACPKIRNLKTYGYLDLHRYPMVFWTSLPRPSEPVHMLNDFHIFHWSLEMGPGHPRPTDAAARPGRWTFLGLRFGDRHIQSQLVVFLP